MITPSPLGQDLVVFDVSNTHSCMATHGPMQPMRRRGRLDVGHGEDGTCEQRPTWPKVALDSSTSMVAT